MLWYEFGHCLAAKGTQTWMVLGIIWGNFFKDTNAADPPQAYRQEMTKQTHSLPGTSDSSHLVSVTVFKTLWPNNNNLVILIMTEVPKMKTEIQRLPFQTLEGLPEGRWETERGKMGREGHDSVMRERGRELTERKRNPEGEEGGKFRSENGQIFSRTV